MIHDLVRQIELLARHAQRIHHLITRCEARRFLLLAPDVRDHDDQCHGCREGSRHPNEAGHFARRRRALTAGALFRCSREHTRGELLTGIDRSKGLSQLVVQIVVHYRLTC